MRARPKTNIDNMLKPPPGWFPKMTLNYKIIRQIGLGPFYSSAWAVRSKVACIHLHWRKTIYNRCAGYARCRSFIVLYICQAYFHPSLLLRDASYFCACLAPSCLTASSLMLTTQRMQSPACMSANAWLILSSGCLCVMNSSTLRRPSR